MTKLDPALQDAVLARLAKGWTAARCAEWLAKSRGVKVTPQAITKMARARRSERGDVSKSVVREEIGRRLPGDLEDLAARREHLQKMVGKLERLVEEDPAAMSMYLKALEQLRRMTELSLRFSGAAETDEVVGGLADLLHAAVGEAAVGRA